MALQKGDAACTSGLSKRIYDARYASITIPGGYPGGLTTAVQAALKADSYAIAVAVVEEIQANGVAEIGTSLGALQVTTTDGDDTDPPKEVRTIPLK